MKQSKSLLTKIIKPVTALVDVLSAPTEKPQKTLAEKIYIRKHYTINTQIYFSVKSV